MIVSIISFFSFFLIIILINKISVQRSNRRKYTIPKTIKKNYKKILAPTNKIIIESSEYFDNSDPDITPQGFFPFFKDSERGKGVIKYVSILTYSTFLNNAKCIFKSVPINFSSSELKEFFAKEDFIVIYYDELNLANNVFDLASLYKH